MKKGIGLLVLLSLICGVSFAGEVEEQEKIDYGFMFGGLFCRFRVEMFFASRLKDPKSVKYSYPYLLPRRCTLNKSTWFGSKRVFSGYVVEVWVNAKNSFGAYTGNKRYQFLFKNGKIYGVSGDFGSGEFARSIISSYEFSGFNHALHIEE